LIISVPSACRRTTWPPLLRNAHCVNVHFKSTGIDVDVVPVLYEGDADDRGYLIAKDAVDRTDWVAHQRQAAPRRRSGPEERLS
jgi:hypothetical protein